MSGLPFLQFYPGDWVKDTRALSPEAKGAWIDILCALHFSATRGKLAMSVESWARAIGQSPDKTRTCIDELRMFGTCDHDECNGVVTLISRRMLRESITKEQTRLRVEQHRLKQKQQEDETAKKRECNGQCNAPVSKCNGEEAQKPISQNPETNPLPVKPAKKVKPRNPLFDAVAEVTGVNPATSGGEIAKAVKSIQAIAPDVTPSEIQRRWENGKTHFTDPPGPSGLAKWWNRFDQPKSNGSQPGYHPKSCLDGLDDVIAHFTP